MKIYKKTLVGLGLILGLVSGPAHKTLAYVNSSPPITKASVSLSFQNRSTISGKINGQDVSFTDSDPTDSTYHYSIDQSNLFCNDVSISINNNALALTTSGNPTASSATASAEFDVSRDGTKAGCSSPIKTSFTDLPIGNIQAGMNYLAWQNGGTLKIDGGATLTEVEASNLYESSTSDGCGGGTVAVVSGDGSGATIFTLTSQGNLGRAKWTSAGAFPQLSSTSLANGCFVHAINNQTVTSLASDEQDLAKLMFGIAGSRPTSGTGGVGTGGTGSTASTADSGTDTSACVFKTNSSGFDTALSWILCPVINGLSASADGINSFVESQLNFSIHENLSGSVQKAWSVFREITTAALVIVMLIMVLSQAIGGGGPFDAYTIRKLLPRLAAAIILMQVSWYLCIWLITLANDAGGGIASLMSVPFGGTGALDLASLLHRLSPFWAATIGLGTTAGVITAAVFAGPLLAFGWPVLLLAVILVTIAVIVALATLLFRNAFLILLVILSPLAFLAYVLPGTDRYWKYWKDNFIRLLLFFPLVMAMIYGGRIFAWTAGNLGGAGPLDVIMVIVGFFGPYFLLPKSFKWGGTLLAQASKGLNESWPVKKSTEVAQKGLMGRQQRKLNEFAKDLDPKRDNYLQREPGRRFGIIPNYRGSLARTALWNVRAGRLIPTKRGLASAIQRGETWNSEEDAIAAAKVKREQDKAASEDPNNLKQNPTFTHSLNPDGTIKSEVSENATARGKAALFNAAGRTDLREAGVAAERALRTSSWVEMGKNLVPVEDDSEINPDGLAARIRASGAEIFEGDSKNPAQKGKLFVKMYDLPRYNSKVNASEELYPLPIGKFLLATPHITNPENKPSSATIAAAQREENEAAAQEDRQPRKLIPHHIERAINVIDNYMDAGNITSQSEAEFGEFGRLAQQDPRVAVAFGSLLHRIASGGQGGINVLTQLNSSQSMQNTIRGILESGTKAELFNKGLITRKQAEDRNFKIGVGHTDIEGYLREGKENMNPAPTTSVPSIGEAAQPVARSPQPAAAPAAAPQTTVVPSGGGQVIIQHEQPRTVQLQPGESVSPGGVVLSTRAQDELNANFDAMRRELRELKRLGVRNQQQQNRLEVIQSSHPDWEDEDEEER
jgi:hypothetical protein